jgi:hypothetical protein
LKSRQNKNNNMKNLGKIITLLFIVSSVFVSCKKTMPVLDSSIANSKETVASSKILGPLIIATTNQIVTYRLGSRLFVTFDGLTNSYYGAGLYAHTATSASGPWTAGVLPYSYVNPSAKYSLGVTYPVGSTVYIFYSTNLGIAYPAGSASVVYSVIV